MSTTRIKQRGRPVHIGRDKDRRIQHGPIDVSLSSEMNDGPGLVFSQKTLDQRRIANMSFDKKMTWITIECVQICTIACIRQSVKVHHR